ncbi:hypothetical protein PGT21_012284 [Puccinia graminis f. sp. tritici]|uniref:Uncharacterized protein n=1 Tax=Puccinia graminis f. sp. tritici TaxID=56615 RepID=A0A5B0Q5B8_PUCGR|nr:hypothetical protein PGT21_012284 [Puccinia graminis f. sp. tritici]KAA1138632.1 hypothetical protein PGTUg99_032232 [Puccinia graminis f. sp. tritici]
MCSLWIQRCDLCGYQHSHRPCHHTLAGTRHTTENHHRQSTRGTLRPDLPAGDGFLVKFEAYPTLDEFALKFRTASDSHKTVIVAFMEFLLGALQLPAADPDSCLSFSYHTDDGLHEEHPHHCC